MLKEQLTDLAKRLEELEGVARGLPNQNFADIAMIAKAKIGQLCDHPDLQAMDEKMYGVTPSDSPSHDAPAFSTARSQDPEPPVTPFQLNTLVLAQ